MSDSPTPLWRMHCASICQRVAALLRGRYEVGQEGHGGNLWRKPTLPHAMEELSDLNVYMWNHVDHVSMVLFHLDEAAEELHRATQANGVGIIPSFVPDICKIGHCIAAARNILRHGNEQGLPETENEKQPDVNFGIPFAPAVN